MPRRHLGTPKRALSPPTSATTPETEAKTPRPRGAVVRQALLDACQHLLETLPPSQITTARLLKEAGVARATLYHHFESAEALLQSTLVDVFVRRAAQNIALMKQAVARSRTREEFIAALRHVTELSQAPAQRRDRLDRVRLVAHTENSPAFQAAMARAQEQLTETLVWVARTGQRRGWVRKDLAPRPIAVFVQAYTLGRIVDDVGERRMRPAEWTQLINVLVVDGVTTVGTMARERTAPRALRTPATPPSPQGRPGGSSRTRRSRTPPAHSD